jgi:hypothetical protein|tara:strand:- start:112 stop:417 length:306 start_codon:yes stop_codon:yes gene_type:complete
MNIWVTLFYQGSEKWLSTHLTEKGALIYSIIQISDFIYGGRSIEQSLELKTMYDYPTSPEQELKSFSKQQLNNFYDKWIEELRISSNNSLQHEINKTEVMA